MKKVYIVHGGGGSPKEPMHVWLRSQLEKKGFHVEVPLMPDRKKPRLGPWLRKLKHTVVDPDVDTYFIGHSLGCQTILRYLQTRKKKTRIGGLVLIAPWLFPNEEQKKRIWQKRGIGFLPWVLKPINYKKIKRICPNTTAIFSSNDESVMLSTKDFIREKLGARIIVEKNKGHYKKSDGTKDNKTALKEILRFEKK